MTSSKKSCVSEPICTASCVDCGFFESNSAFCEICEKRTIFDYDLP